jgi:hypothetical protein
VYYDKRGLGVSLKNVDDEALSALPRFAALEELTPIDVRDEGFRHVGGCLAAHAADVHVLPRDDRCGDGTHRRTTVLVLLRGTDADHRSKSRGAGRDGDAIEQVELYECKGVTDAGFPFLARLPRLHEVHLDGLPGVTLEETKIFPAHVCVHYTT